MSNIANKDRNSTSEDDDEDYNPQDNNNVVIGDFKSKYSDWENSVAMFVSNTLWEYQQFIGCDGDIGVGSDIQRLICQSVNIPKKYRLVFWGRRGASVVRDTLRKKRQATATAMKKQFKCKYQIYLPCDEIFPNLNKIALFNIYYRLGEGIENKTSTSG